MTQTMSVTPSTRPARLARGLALLGFGLLAACAGKDAAAPPGPAAAAAQPAPPTREQLLAATVEGVFHAPVTLEAGRYPGAAERRASRATLTLLEPTVVFGDVDGMPPGEAVALLSAGGTSGAETVHVAAFAMRDGRATSIATAPVGDRARVFRSWLERDRLHVDVVEPAPGEAACCPTQLTRKVYGWQDGTLALLEATAVGTLSINLLAATDWMLVEMDGQPVPEGLLPPTALIQYGKITGFAGCNRYSGPVEERRPGSFAVGDVVATRKGCEAPAMTLETQFLERLARVDAYAFSAGRLVLTGPGASKAERTTLVFAR